jgi:hypothetical protein
MIHMFAQGIAQPDCGRADYFAMPGDIGEYHAGNYAMATGRQVIKITTACLTQRTARYPTGKSRQFSGIRRRVISAM